MFNTESSLRTLPLPQTNSLELWNIKGFYSFSDFNSMQKQCSSKILKTNENILIQAPTASGKSLLFDFALFKLFGVEKEPNQKLVIYVAPLKALCNEKFLTWKSLFEKNKQNV